MANVTIYLPDDIIARCRAAATEDKRSLSNYLAGLLERAHPPMIASTTAEKQIHHRRNLEARSVRMSERIAKRK